MSKKEVDIGIRLSGTDDASAVVRGMVDKSAADLERLGKKAALSTRQVAIIGAASYAGFRALDDASEKFEEQQYAKSNLRIAAMDKYGNVNEKLYGQEEDFLKRLSSTYSKSVTDYAKLGVVLQANRISAQDFMGGVGEAAAKLGLAMDDIDPATTGEFFAHMSNDMHVSANEMDRLADSTYRLFKSGVGKTGMEAVTQINEAMSKMSLGATNLGLRGMKETEELHVLAGTFIAKGLQGGTVGTNYRRIFDSMRDPEKEHQVVANAAVIGEKLEFFDKDHKFLGLRNFEAQLAKLSKYDPQMIAAILKPFGGKQGLSTDFVEYIAQYGGDIDKFREHYESLGSLNYAVKELIKTQKVQKSITRTNYENMEAAFGKSMKGDVSAINSLLNKSILGVTGFVEHHQGISRLTAEVIALGSAYGSALVALKGLSYFSPKALAALNMLGTSSAFAKFAALAASMLIAKTIAEEWAQWASAQSNKEIKENPTGDRERMMAGMNKVIENPETGFFKRNWARALKFGMASNIALFGDDKPNPDADLSNDSRDKVLGDIKQHRVDDSPWVSNPDTRQWLGLAPSKAAGDPTDWSKNDWSMNSASGKPGPVTIAPVYNINGMTDTSSLLTMLKGNNDQILQMVMDGMRRSKSLSYTGQ